MSEAKFIKAVPGARNSVIYETEADANLVLRVAIAPGEIAIQEIWFQATSANGMGP